MISVVVPTIRGREHWLGRCKVAYAAHTRDYELIVVPDAPTCGEAWNRGAEVARGDYLHFSADDLEPLPGWWEAARHTVDNGGLPGCMLFNPDGSVQHWDEEPFARVPFLNRSMWEAVRPVLAVHYFSDNYVTEACRRAGFPLVWEREYAFTHHLAGEGRRGYGSDGLVYGKWLRGDR